MSINRFQLMQDSSLLRFVCISCLLLSLRQASAQQPPPPKEIKIDSVTVEQGVLPGGNRPWVKLVANFHSTPRWSDGVAFSFTALLGANNQYRVVNGVVRYANIKAGASRAVMYLSPNTAERFGAPVAVKVKAFKEEQSDEAEFKSGGSFPPDWERKFDKYPGLLLSVIQTPWLTTDYSTSPDIFATQ
jgi:hypothetical protein